MKKNIVIAILALLSVAGFVFGFVQSQHAAGFQLAALECEVLSKKYQEQAAASARMAEEVIKRQEAQMIENQIKLLEGEKAKRSQ